MAFTGNEDHSISLTVAAAMTKRFRDTNPPNQTIAHFFGKSAVQELLNQSECVGIRIYYGLNETGARQLICTGVKADGNDLYQGVLIERSITCPIDCSAANPLNTNPTS